MSSNEGGINWIIYLLIFIPLFMLQRSCTGAGKPKFDCGAADTYCYSWKGTNKLAAVVSRGGANVEIRTPVGTGQGRWTGGPGNATAKVNFQTKTVNCYGKRDTSIILGYRSNLGICTD